MFKNDFLFYRTYDLRGNLVVSITIILKNYILQEVTMVKIEDITEDSKGLEFALSLVRTSFNGA
ncbi:MAG: hypothetical protein KKF48_01485, partial [Nanoarchaeota archaeon]|nr:hypothetical protein [Nanoarchaeota archaeon]MBU1027694.1 hypothetical protein [Nanoarchaeota archaeon]